MSKFFRLLLHNSDRPGHLTANATFTAAIAAIAAHQQSLFLLELAAACFLTEWAFSPDMDHDSRKIKGNPIKRLWLTWWAPFKYAVPHRGIFSHSLLVGTPCRVLYAIAPFALIGLAIFPQESLDILRLVVSDPTGALEWGSRWDWVWYGALLSDAVHLAKDRYWPWQMIFGK